MPAPIPYLDADEIARLLPPAAARRSQRDAFEAMAAGTAVLPPRLLLDGPEGSTAFCYAARLSPDGPAVSKLGSVNPGNADRGLPAIHALVSVLDATTGAPALLLDGTAVTAVRTAAASALAVDVLAPAGARTLAVVGTGVQAAWHVRALLDVRPWERIVIVGTDPSRARAFADDLAADACAAGVTAPQPGTHDDALTCDAVVLCTTSRTPLVAADDVRPGTTIVSIGSFAPDRVEVDPALLGRAVCVVDDVNACAGDSGQVAGALADGSLQRADLRAFGDVLLGRVPGRTRDDEIVVHTSVGVGVQDAAAADHVLAALRAQG